MAAVDSIADSIAGAIADGTPVNWATLPAGDAALQAALDELRIIEEVANVHRGLGDPDATVLPVPSVPETRLSGPPADGWHWGPLIVGERLGGGSFGDVYRAWDPQLETEVALKLQPASPTALRDGQLATKVRHPNVITVHGAAEHDGRVGVWMEFIHGKTLEELGSAIGELSAAEAVVVGESLCGALAAVHSAGLLHRDIKAANVMRENGGRMVLIDFGVGTVVEREARSGGGLVGTLLYMAPEVLEGARSSARSDVYGLGVLLFYLVTRTFPVFGRSREELRHAHLTGRRRLLSDVRPSLPQPFVKAVERAISPDPEDRYRTAGELLAALATEPKAPEPKPIPLERYILVTSVGVVLFAILMGALSTAAFNQAFRRTAFANDTPWEWLVFGFKSMLSPAVHLAIILAGAVTCGVVLSWLARRFGAVQRLQHRLKPLAGIASRRLNLQDANGVASFIVLLSVLALLPAWWFFGPILTMSITGVSQVDSATMKLLSPEEHQMYHRMGRLTFACIAAFLGGGGMVAFRVAARKRQRVYASSVAAMFAATFLALMSLGLPYRVVFHSDFPRAIWNTERCYVTGENERDVQLFCPWRDGRTQDRTQLVPADSDALTRLGSTPAAVFCDSIELFDKRESTPSSCS